MDIGRVISKIVSTVKNASFHGRPLLLVQPLSPHFRPVGAETVCIDFIGADVDEIVLILKEGSSVQTLLGNPDAPADAAIVGVIDSIHLHGAKVFDKATDTGTTAEEG